MCKQRLDHATRATLPGEFIKLKCGFTHYDFSRTGSRKTAILVHGFSTPSYIWDPTFKDLADAGFNVLRYDLLGRGFSDRPKRDYTLDLLIEQLNQLIKALEIQLPFQLVGLSFGAWVTTEFVNRFPEKVSSLVLVAPLVSDAPIKKPIFRNPIIGDLFFYLIFSPKWLPASHIHDFFDETRHPDWEDRFRHQLKFEGFNQAILSTYRHLHQVDWRLLYSQFSKLKKPLAIIWGKEDQTINKDEIALLTKMIPEHRLIQVEQAGHIPHFERPEIVSPILVNLLSK